MYFLPQVIDHKTQKPMLMEFCNISNHIKADVVMQHHIFYSIYIPFDFVI